MAESRFISAIVSLMLPMRQAFSEVAPAGFAFRPFNRKNFRGHGQREGFKWSGAVA